MFELNNDIEIAAMNYVNAQKESQITEDALRKEFSKFITVWEKLKLIGNYKSFIIGDFAVGSNDDYYSFYNTVAVQHRLKRLFHKPKTTTILEVSYDWSQKLDPQGRILRNKDGSSILEVKFLNIYDPKWNSVYIDLFNNMQFTLGQLLQQRTHELDLDNAFKKLQFDD